MKDEGKAENHQSFESFFILLSSSFILHPFLHPSSFVFLESAFPDA